MKQTKAKTQLAAAESIAKVMHQQARIEEERWRTANGIADKLRSKRDPVTKPKRRPLERGEVRRREERQQRHIDYALLRKPLLRGVE